MGCCASSPWEGGGSGCEDAVASVAERPAEEPERLVQDSALLEVLRQLPADALNDIWWQLQDQEHQQEEGGAGGGCESPSPSSLLSWMLSCRDAAQLVRSSKFALQLDLDEAGADASELPPAACTPASAASAEQRRPAAQHSTSRGSKRQRNPRYCDRAPAPPLLPAAVRRGLALRRYVACRWLVAQAAELDWRAAARLEALLQGGAPVLGSRVQAFILQAHEGSLPKASRRALDSVVRCLPSLRVLHLHDVRAATTVQTATLGQGRHAGDVGARRPSQRAREASEGDRGSDGCLHRGADVQRCPLPLLGALAGLPQLEDLTVNLSGVEGYGPGSNLWRELAAVTALTRLTRLACHPLPADKHWRVAAAAAAREPLRLGSLRRLAELDVSVGDGVGWQPALFELPASLQVSAATGCQAAACSYERLATRYASPGGNSTMPRAQIC